MTMTEPDKDNPFPDLRSQDEINQQNAEIIRIRRNHRVLQVVLDVLAAVALFVLITVLVIYLPA